MKSKNFKPMNSCDSWGDDEMQVNAKKSRWNTFATKAMMAIIIALLGLQFSANAQGTTITVRKNTDEGLPAGHPVNAIDGADTTLRQAIILLNNGSGGTIKFDGDYTIDLETSALPTITKNIVIDVENNEVTISGVGNLRVFVVDNTLTLKGKIGGGGEPTFKLQHGNATASTGGGAILINNGGVLNAENCWFFENTTTTNGGAVAVLSGGSFSAKGCMFTSNSVTANGTGATALGGAVYVVGSFIAENCLFESNTVSGIGGANAHGGAVNMQPSGTFVAVNCEFAENAASQQGGAVRLAGNSTAGATFVAVNCIFAGNQAGTLGGAVIANDFANKIYVYHCTFHANNSTNANSGKAVHLIGSPSTSTLNSYNCIYAGTNTLQVVGAGANWAVGNLVQRAENLTAVPPITAITEGMIWSGSFDLDQPLCFAKSATKLVASGSNAIVAPTNITGYDAAGIVALLAKDAAGAGRTSEKVTFGACESTATFSFWIGSYNTTTSAYNTGGAVSYQIDDQDPKTAPPSGVSGVPCGSVLKLWVKPDCDYELINWVTIGGVAIEVDDNDENLIHFSFLVDKETIEEMGLVNSSTTPAGYRIFARVKQKTTGIPTSTLVVCGNSGSTPNVSPISADCPDCAIKVERAGGLGTAYTDPKLGDDLTKATHFADVPCKEEFTLTATPVDCYEFVEWKKLNGGGGWDDAGSANPLTITVTGNINYAAVFALKDPADQYDLQVVLPEGGVKATVGTKEAEIITVTKWLSGNASFDLSSAIDCGTPITLEPVLPSTDCKKFAKWEVQEWDGASWVAKADVTTATVTISSLQKVLQYKPIFAPITDDAEKLVDANMFSLKLRSEVQNAIRVQYAYNYPGLTPPVVVDVDELFASQAGTIKIPCDVTVTLTVPETIGCWAFEDWFTALKIDDGVSVVTGGNITRTGREITFITHTKGSAEFVAYWDNDATVEYDVYVEVPAGAKVTATVGTKSAEDLTSSKWLSGLANHPHDPATEDAISCNTSITLVATAAPACSAFVKWQKKNMIFNADGTFNSWSAAVDAGTNATVTFTLSNAVEYTPVFDIQTAPANARTLTIETVNETGTIVSDRGKVQLYNPSSPYGTVTGKTITTTCGTYAMYFKVLDIPTCYEFDGWYYKNASNTLVPATDVLENGSLFGPGNGAFYVDNLTETKTLFAVVKQRTGATAGIGVYIINDGTAVGGGGGSANTVIPTIGSTAGPAITGPQTIHPDCFGKVILEAVPHACSTFVGFYRVGTLGATPSPTHADRIPAMAGTGNANKIEIDVVTARDVYAYFRNSGTNNRSIVVRAQYEDGSAVPTTVGQVCILAPSGTTVNAASLSQPFNCGLTTAMNFRVYAQVVNNTTTNSCFNILRILDESGTAVMPNINSQVHWTATTPLYTHTVAAGTTDNCTLTVVFGRAPALNFNLTVNTGTGATAPGIGGGVKIGAGGTIASTQTVTGMSCGATNIPPSQLIYAEPGACKQFVGWRLGTVSTNFSTQNPLNAFNVSTLGITGNAIITAIFEDLPTGSTFALTTASRIIDGGTTDLTGTTITRNPSGNSFNCGTTVTLTASATGATNTNYEFVHWFDATAGANHIITGATTPTVTITMDKAKTIHAMYRLKPVLTTSLRLENGTTLTGTITRTVGGTANAGPYNTGTNVTLVATLESVPANACYEFLHWFDASAGVNQIITGATTPTVTVSMDANKDIRAIYRVKTAPHTLTASPMTLTPVGGGVAIQVGTVTINNLPSPQNLGCNSTATVRAAIDPAVLNAGCYEFDRWYAGASGTTEIGTIGDPVLTVNLLKDSTVRAAFRIKGGMTLTQQVDANLGTVVPNQGLTNLNCGDVVEFTAARVPNTQRTIVFTGWTITPAVGPAVTKPATENPYIHTVTGNATIEANFTEYDWTLGGKVIMKNGKAIAQVTEPNYQFIGWYDKLTDKLVCSENELANCSGVDVASVTAKFGIAVCKVDVVITGTGTVTPTGTKVTGTDNKFVWGSSVTLQATGNFSHWEDEEGNPVSYETTYTFNVLGDRKFVAVFN